MTKELFVYGLHPVTEAIKSGKEIDKVLIQKGLRAESFQFIRQLLSDTSIPYQFVPVEKLNRITGKNHQGLIALISPITYQKLEDIIPWVYEQGEMPLFLILDGITDIRNFGAICRSAECFGVHAVVIPSRGSAQVNEDAIKTSAGALNRIPVCKSSSLKEAVLLLKQSGIQIVGATEKSSENIYKTNLGTPLAFILGAEDKGIQSELLQISDHVVRIPISGHVNSLNVSVAAGVCIYEAVRQRAKNEPDSFLK